MNKKLFLLLTTSVISLFFAACSGDVVESTATSNRAKLSLTVTVQDKATGTLLEADVSLNNGAAKKAASGIAVFEDVSTGTHTLQANVAGYAAALVSPLEIDPVTGQNAQIPRDYAATIALYPLTSSLWGYLQYTDSVGVLKPVPAGITVNLKLNDRSGGYYNDAPDTAFVNKLFKATTDATGKYSFDSLPAVGTGYTIWVSETSIGSINYGITNLAPVSLTAAGAFNVVKATLSNQTNLFVVSDYPSQIFEADIAKPIKFKFTEPVNTNLINSSSISINPSDIAVATAWDATKTELTLTPMGNWKGLTSVTLNLKSVSGKELASVVCNWNNGYDNRYNYYYSSCEEMAEDYGYACWRRDGSNSNYCNLTNNFISTGQSLYRITVIPADLPSDPVIPEVLTPDIDKINYNSTVVFKFNKVKGATKYYIYTNNNTEGFYTRNQTINANSNDNVITETEDSYTSSIQFSSLFREVGILIQADNGTSKTSLDETKAVKIKDVVKPTGANAETDVNLSTYGKKAGICPVSITSVANICSGTSANTPYAALYNQYPLHSLFYASTVEGYQDIPIDFSEPVQDITDANIAIDNGGGNATTLGRIAVKNITRTSSSNARRITVRVTVAPNATTLTSAQNLDAVLTITGIKDLSGNPFEITYTDGTPGGATTTDIAGSRTNDLKVRLYTSF